VILLFVVKIATTQTIPQSGLVDMRALAGVLKTANAQVNALLHAREQQTPKHAELSAIEALPEQSVAADDWDFDEEKFDAEKIDTADLIFVKLSTSELELKEEYQKLYDGFRKVLTKTCEGDECLLKMMFVTDVPLSPKRQPADQNATYIYATAWLNDNVLFPGFVVGNDGQLKSACADLGLNVMAIKSYRDDNGRDDNDDNDDGDNGDDTDGDKGDDKGSPKKKNVGLIIGLVALGLLTASVIIGLVVMNIRMRRQLQSTSGGSANYSGTSVHIEGGR